MTHRARIAATCSACVGIIVLGLSTLAVADGSIHHSPKHRADERFVATTHISPRVQWEANFGYCGETSFISAGLSYGQYLSQYDARSLASDGKDQSQDGSQLLLGVNDAHAARAMHLAFTSWKRSPGATSTQFLSWVKQQVFQGRPVIMGVYNNEYRLYGKTSPNAGDSEYDHIVSVTRITSHSPPNSSSTSSPDDTISFDDHGLWTGADQAAGQSFTYRFGAFPGSRRQANARTGPIYRLPDHTIDYGISITGVADPTHETLPVRLISRTNSEGQSMKDGSALRPKPQAIRLTAIVSGLTPGSTYNLYRYDSAAKVPDRAFNAHQSLASQTWHFRATSTTFTVSEEFMSSDEVFYRAVPTGGA